MSDAPHERDPEGAAPAAGTAPAAGDGAGAGVTIGHFSGGSLATGSHGTAISHNWTAPPEGTGQAQQELLSAVRELRADLARFRAGPETVAVDGELAEVEGDISSTGTVRPGLLARVRVRLEDSTAAFAALGSSAAVAQAITQILG